MAGGGWSKQGSGIPLADRVRVGGSSPTSPTSPTASGPTPSAPASGPDPDTCPARHCWVSDAADGEGVKRPGLLVEWRSGEAGWEGRVIYGSRLRGRDWGLVEEWLPAVLLTPL